MEEPTARPSTTVIVVAGGGPLDARAVAALPTGTVIAADSGYEHAGAAGLAVDVVVGDLDSLPSAALTSLTADGSGIEVERHPVDKDATDLELALAAAHRFHPERIVVVGSAGGRFDHVLGNVAVLAGPAARTSGSDEDPGPAVEAWFGAAHVRVVTRWHPAEITGGRGELVSLLALHGPVHGVRTTGLRWTLDGDELRPGSARGLSNELVAARATVHVADGSLLVVQPETGHDAVT